MSFRLKLSLIVLVSVAVLLLTNYFLTKTRLKTHLLASQKEWVATLAEGLAENLSQDVIDGKVIKVRQVLHRLAQQDEAIEYLYVTDFDDRIFAHSFEQGFPQYLARHYQQSGTFSDFGRNLQFRTSRQQINEYKQPLIKGLKAELHIGVGQKEIQSAIQKILFEQAGMIILVGLLLMSACWLAVRSILRPLTQLSANMQAFADGKIEHLMDSKVSDPDLRKLLTVFNRMVRARSQAEKSLKDNETKLSLMLNSIGDAVIATDADGNIVMMNPIAEQLTAFFESEVVGKPLDEILVLVNAQTREKVENPVDKVLRTGKIVGLANHTVLVNRYQREYQIADSAAPIIDDNGEVFGIIMVFRDVTEEYRLQQAEKDALLDLKRQENELNQILDTLNSAIIKIDQQGLIVKVNQTALSLFEYTEEQLLGKNISLLMPEPYSSQHDGYLKRLVDSHQAMRPNFNRELPALRSNGEVFTVRLSITELPSDGDGCRYFVGSLYDLTEQKQQEALLRRAHKMDAVGMLTGGIAHDFNNQLGVVQGYLELLLEQYRQSRQMEWLESALKSTRHCIELSRKLLNFSSNRVLNPKVTDVNKILVDMRDLISRTLTPQVELVYDLDQEELLVMINSDEFEDVIINLVVNALDAMKVTAAKLIIRSHLEIIDEHYVDIHQVIKPGAYASVCIIDNGEGISKANMERIFEPFFTTKPPGKGTGLGLAMVYSLARKNNGMVSIYSEVGMGTTVKLLLPLYQDDGQPEGIEIEDASQGHQGIPTGNGQTILIVDDEASLLALAETIIQGLGYQVIKAENADQALQCLKENDSIDLILTDVIMPGSMTGIELAMLVRRQYPNIEIILTSGYMGNQTLEAKAEQLATCILSKPYNKKELAQVLASLLNSGTMADKPDQSEIKPRLPLIEWSPDYQLGHEVIDAAHRRIFAVLQEYRQLLDNETPEMELLNFLNKLSAAIQQQLEKECEVLRDLAYPFVENHCKVHELFLTEIKKQVRTCLHQPSIFEHLFFLHYLYNWMRDHIQSMDRCYMEFIEHSN